MNGRTKRAQGLHVRDWTLKLSTKDQVNGTTDPTECPYNFDSCTRNKFERRCCKEKNSY